MGEELTDVQEESYTSPKDVKVDIPYPSVIRTFDENDIEIKRLSDDIPIVDVIVVTPILELEEIKVELQNKEYIYRVVSMEDIMNDLKE